MPEALLAGAGVATEWLLTYLLHSSVLIGLAWLAVRTGRVRRILSLRAGPKPASRGRRVLAGVGLLLPLLLLPSMSWSRGRPRSRRPWFSFQGWTRNASPRNPRRPSQSGRPSPGSTHPYIPLLLQCEYCEPAL